MNWSGRTSSGQDKSTRLIDWTDRFVLSLVKRYVLKMWTSSARPGKVSIAFASADLRLDAQNSAGQLPSLPTDM